MSGKYHQLKQTKYIWLYSINAKIVRETGVGVERRHHELQWDNIPDLKLSNNAQVSVCGYQSKLATAGVGLVVRCKNIPNNLVYDSSFTSYPIIHIAKSPSTANVEFESIKYNIGSCDRWKSINLSFGDTVEPEVGIPGSTQAVGRQEFIIGLKFEDYEEVEIQPKLMPSTADYHKYPQDRLQQKYI